MKNKTERNPLLTIRRFLITVWPRHVISDVGDDTLRGAGPADVVHFLLLCPGFAWSAASVLCPTKAAMSHQTGIQGSCFLYPLSLLPAVLPYDLCECLGSAAELSAPGNGSLQREASVKLASHS